MTVRPRLAITLGDAAGIGPEVIAKALPREIELGRSIPMVIGDARVVERELERHSPGWKVVLVDSFETFEAHCLLSVLTMQAKALVQVRSVGALRECLRKVA